MKTSSKRLNVQTNVKAGGIDIQHNRSFKVRSALEARVGQHNNRGLNVRSAVKAGGMSIQHNRGITVR